MSNEEQLTWFAHVLVVRLQACFACKHTSIVLRKERFWSSYQRLRTSDTFVQSWKDFIQKTVHLKAFPAFYQFVTQHIFDILIKLEFPVNSAVSVSDSECVRPLTHQERCALRYVAGYIIRTVYEKIESGSHPKIKEMMCFVMEFAGDGISSCESEEWVDLVNRGGLWTVNNQAYDIFLIMEDLIRRHFTLASNRIEGAATCVEAIVGNNDLLFQWCIIAAQVEEDVSKLVLQRIVSLYVTVRGFGFASSCMELYKQAQHKTMSKTRALRSELCPKQ